MAAAVIPILSGLARAAPLLASIPALGSAVKSLFGGSAFAGRGFVGRGFVGRGVFRGRGVGLSHGMRGRATGKLGRLHRNSRTRSGALDGGGFVSSVFGGLRTVGRAGMRAAKFIIPIASTLLAIPEVREAATGAAVAAGGFAGRRAAAVANAFAGRDAAAAAAGGALGRESADAVMAARGVARGVRQAFGGSGLRNSGRRQAGSIVASGRR